MLLGASLPSGASGIVADLGASSGAAGLAAICINPDLKALLVEIRPELTLLATQTLSLPANQHFADRVKILHADVTLTGEKRTEVGLLPDSVDYVIINPPYNQPSLRASPDPLKAEAHVMGEGGLDAWLRTASAILKPGGLISLIYRTERLGEVIACSQGRFGDLQVLPVYSKANEAAKRIVIRGKRASNAPLRIVPGIVMHDDEGNPTPQADAAINGIGPLLFAD